MSTDFADRPFDTIAACIRRHARARPDAPALSDGESSLSYAALDARMDRVRRGPAARRHRARRRPIALCGAPSVEQAVVFLGALRAGVVVAPLAPGSTPASLARMLADAQASRLFVDAGTATAFAGSATADARAWTTVSRPGSHPPAPCRRPVEIRPDSPFNIIYSSGTTGEPKGIVQPHGMRWAHVRRGLPYGYGPGAVTLLATPLYSNTTLVVFFPSLAFGGSRGADAEVRRARLPAAGAARARHAHHAGAGAVPAADGARASSTASTCRPSA